MAVPLFRANEDKGRRVPRPRGAMRRPGIWLFLCAAILNCPAWAAWDRFEIVEWQARDVRQLTALRRLGVTAATVIADRGDGLGRPLDVQTAAPRASGLRWYIENIATDFYAPYHQYTPGKPEHWRFLAVQQRYGRDPTALYREPSLLDPVWRERIRRRVTAIVAQQKPYKPLFYSLGDETGIADLAAAWDFDVSPRSVAAFRGWVRSRYRTLDALNGEWDTRYMAWGQIEPETTAQALMRRDGNHAAWSDFKAFMDWQFADALRFGAAAVRAADPAALTGIEGAQVPGWGGYDYSKLAGAVDVMEIYDNGENLPILRALSPSTIALTTSGAGDPASIHAIWRSVLRGVKGLVLWDAANDIVRPDGTLLPRGQAYAPLFAALHGPVVRRLLTADPLFDSVAVLYSPASFRVRWLLDRKADGADPAARTAEDEGQPNAWRDSLTGYSRALASIGLRPRFITPEQLAAAPPPERLLILPHAIALSPEEIRSVERYSGTVFADTQPGLFDGHGKRQSVPMPRVKIVPPADIARESPLRARFPVMAPGGDVETWLYRAGQDTWLALHRARSSDRPETVTLRLGTWRARDLMHARDLPPAETIELTLDGVEPMLLELRNQAEPSR